MILKDLIAFLAAADQELVVLHGFAHPHSYRGYYDQLAFKPAASVTVASMLACAKRALGATYSGWKGGEYTMGEYTEVWLAEVGSCGETIGKWLLTLMFNESLLSVGRETSLVGELRVELAEQKKLIDEAREGARGRGCTGWSDEVTVAKKCKKLIHVEFAPGECGWAIDLGGGRFRINNVPMTAGLNFGDVVMLLKGNVVSHVVLREFTKKTRVEYPEPYSTNYEKIRVALDKAGCVVEGMVPGILFVAHTEDVDPKKMIAGLGVKVRARRVALVRE